MYPGHGIIALECGESAIFDFDLGYGYICISCGFKIKGSKNECESGKIEHGRLATNLSNSCS